MDLKMHLEILAPFVKMAKKTTMCNCQLGGTPATRREVMRGDVRLGTLRPRHDILTLCPLLGPSNSGHVSQRHLFSPFGLERRSEKLQCHLHLLADDLCVSCFGSLFFHVPLGVGRACGAKRRAWRDASAPPGS